MENIWQWIYDLPLSASVRESEYLFPTLEWIHIYSMISLISLFSAVDLRLLGFSLGSQKPIAGTVKKVIPAAWVAFGVNVVTGTLLFMSASTDYVANIAFLVKISLIAVAFFYHWFALPAVARREDAAGRSGFGKAVAGLSLAIWIGIIAASRWIAFV